MGLAVSLADPDQPRCAIEKCQPFHLGGVGQSFVNGAVIAAMFDFVIGLSALKFTHLGNFATTSVNIKLVKPVEPQDVYAKARCTQQIGSRLFVEAVLVNDEDQVCCYATGEIRIGIG